MRKSEVCIIIIFLCLFSGVKAQEVVATAGNSFTNNNLQLNWTLGESVISTLSNQNTVLTQGFHQSKIIVTAVDEFPELSFDISAYPNPTSNHLKVKIEKTGQQDLFYTLYSLDGRIMAQKQIETSVSEIPMYSYVSATYLLKVFNKNNVLKTFKIIKK
ncbi:T9SS type A sorting domain-containing protein [Maribellus comscasis]|uniref:T9SS type A sorting domain-containing protein n=1 Tax=Maribellus comscasis TaxID=2681766 RepID=A0A6I6JPC2_9BACT|nr:T9SS type A sorting domain-containing protein [Maribellus comscasis]QGY42989.1 T9SS type A sorting domain-containing protein [Maribellus comscasis]